MGLGKILFALVIVVVGVAIIGFGVMDYQNRQSDIQNAVQVEGTVQSVDVHERSSEGSDSSYNPYIKYTYSYEGQQHTSRSVYPGLNQRTFDNRNRAEEVVSEYSSGETTTVYVNQEDPSSAFLVKETQTTRSFLIMGFGLVFVVMGIISFRY
jgi:uncharacterized membrane protein YidH (DUF202 family)